MNKIFISSIFVLLLFSSVVFAASSANYIMATQVIEAVKVGGSSTSYSMNGQMVSLGIAIPASSNISIGEGLFKSSYFGGQPILNPIITSISPTDAKSGDKITLTVNGANFTDGMTLKITITGETDIAATNVSVASTTKFTCELDLKNAKGGYWNVIASDKNGRSSTLSSALKIAFQAPSITSITPGRGLNNGVVKIEILGDNFRSGLVVKLSKTGESDILSSSVNVESSTKVTANFDLNGKTPGEWDVSVVNDDDQLAKMLLSFKIESPVLTVTQPIASTKNPFNPIEGSTVFSYSLSKDEDVTIFVFNMRGERVWQWTAPAGTDGGKVGVNQVTWDGLNAFKSYVSSGVYLVHITVKENGAIKTITKTKLAVIK